MTKKRLIKKFLKSRMPVIRGITYLETNIDPKFGEACQALFEVYLYEKYGKHNTSSFRQFLARTSSL